MAYTFEQAKKAAEEILKNKGRWQIANNVKSAESKKIKQDAEKRAGEYYNELKTNGYGTLAGNLESSDFGNAQKYLKTFLTKTGRSQFRPYMYEKGRTYGLTSKQIDNLTGFDNDTGEVIFAGKSIGKPAGIVNGASYFDADYLDKVFENYVSDSGIHRSDEKLAGINSEELRGKINKAFDIQQEDRDIILEKTERLEEYNYDHNPYKSEIGKSIMKEYEYMGENAAGDAVAEGAAENSGNIDSFSVANAARQQLAFKNAGRKAVLEDFNSRISNARGILSDLGIYLQNNQDNMYRTAMLQHEEAKRLSESASTKQYNEVLAEGQKYSNLEKEAAITGYIPAELQNKNNPYLNEDGTIKDVDIDYNERITRLENQLENESDENTRDMLKKNISWLNDARNEKLKLPEYKKYSNDRAVIYKSPEKTADMKNAEAQMQNALDMVKAEYDSNERINSEKVGAELQMNRYSEDSETARNRADNENAIEQIALSKGINSVKIGAIGQGMLNTHHVSSEGEAMLNALREKAKSNGDYLTEDEIFDFIVTHSDRYNVDLEQVKNIYSYLGIDKTRVYALEDADENDKTKGVVVRTD